MKDLDTLIQKARNRDTRAFDQLYTRTSREIGWYCKRLCGNEFDTQDLMQEVYLTAWIKLPQYAGVNFPAWLRSIAHNSFLNRLKKYRLEQLTEEVPDGEPQDELRGPVHITEQREMRRLMLQTIDNALSPVQRMTVLLYYYDELSVGEIARCMECTEGTVKSRLYLARRKLREAFGQSAENLLSGVPCVMPILRYEAVHSRPTAALLTRWGILSKISGKAAILSAKTAVGVGSAAVLTATGTAFVLHPMPEKQHPQANSIAPGIELQHEPERIVFSETTTSTNYQPERFLTESLTEIYETTVTTLAAKETRAVNRTTTTTIPSTSISTTTMILTTTTETTFTTNHTSTNEPDHMQTSIVNDTDNATVLTATASAITEPISLEGCQTKTTISPDATTTFFSIPGFRIQEIESKNCYWIEVATPKEINGNHRTYAPTYLPHSVKLSDTADIVQGIDGLWYDPPSDEKGKFVSDQYIIYRQFQNTDYHCEAFHSADIKLNALEIHGCSGFLLTSQWSADFTEYRLAWLDDVYVHEIWSANLPDNYVDELMKMAESVQPIEMS